MNRNLHPGNARLVPLVLSIIAVGSSADWQWIPQEEHPCNIRRLNLAEVHDEFGPRGLPPLYPHAVVIRTALDRNAVLRSKTARDEIVQQFSPDFNVTLSSSNALSERRRTIPWKQYLQELDAQPETTLHRLSNESWYLFGETYSQPWQDLMQSYVLPPCTTCRRDDHSCALAFGLGNRGSGVQWHTHGPGFSEALHGRKHWIMSPHAPNRAHKDQSSLQWMQEEYRKAKKQNKEFYECTLDPGDLVYFPDRWWHATINLDPYTAFLSTFTTEHGVELDQAGEL